MHIEFPEGPDDDITEWWAPLEAVTDLLPPGRPYEFFDVGDFMLMCRIAVPRGGPIYEYKHVYTRRHLVLDEGCRPWGYVPPRRLDQKGRYVRVPSLTAALDGLWLHELPWMKEGLEHERVGPSPFDQRVQEQGW